MKNRKKIITLTIIVSMIIAIVIGVGGVKIANANKINSSLELGIKYLTEGNYEEAKLEFSKAISIDDKNEKATDLLGLTEDYIKLNELYSNKEYLLAAELISKIKGNKYLEYVEGSVNEISANTEAKVIIINEINNLDAQIQQLISENKFQEAIDLINKYLGEDLKQEYLDKLNELMNGVNDSKTVYEEEQAKLEEERRLEEERLAEEERNKNNSVGDEDIINLLNNGFNFQEGNLLSSRNINSNIKYNDGSKEYLMYVGNEKSKNEILNTCSNFYSVELSNAILRAFIEVDGNLYRMSGNGSWEEKVLYIINKQVNEDTIQLTLETLSEGEKFKRNAKLIFQNGKWVIDEYDALLIGKNWRV